ncbi:MAG: PF13754 domain-containing protein [Acutalibacteraceae bacterium]
MNKPEILRVWGKADNFDIEFTHEGGIRWKCFVPPDTKDGQYAVEIWAINEFGELGYWTGELFMSSGVCCLKFNQSPYQIWIKPSETMIRFSSQTSHLSVRKGCSHVRCN